MGLLTTEKVLLQEIDFKELHPKIRKQFSKILRKKIYEPAFLTDNNIFVPLVNLQTFQMPTKTNQLTEMKLYEKTT